MLRYIIGKFTIRKMSNDFGTHSLDFVSFFFETTSMGFKHVRECLTKIVAILEF
jgi:hypothetical protein